MEQEIKKIKELNGENGEKSNKKERKVTECRRNDYLQDITIFISFMIISRWKIEEIKQK